MPKSDFSAVTLACDINYTTQLTLDVGRVASFRISRPALLFNKPRGTFGFIAVATSLFGQFLGVTDVVITK